MKQSGAVPARIMCSPRDMPRLALPLTLAFPILVACATEPPPAPAPIPAPAPLASAPAPIASVPAPIASVPAPAPAPDPTPSTPTGGGAKPKDPRTQSWAHWPVAWTDPRVVKVLAESCDFSPVTPPDEQGGADTPEDVFACKLPYEQACMVSECRHESDACDGVCEGSCGTCGASCTTQCGTCEAACKDAACKLACATTTAQCKQACARTMDRCASGTCAAADKACGVTHQKAYAAHACRPRCDKHDHCYDACAHIQDSTAAQACQQQCDGALDAGYPTCTVACRTPGRSPLDEAKCENACWLRFPCNLLSCATGG